MVKLKALKELHYSQKTYLTGEAFEASEQDAKTLQIIGFAELHHEDSKPAEEEKPKADEKEKKHYKRRDMQAE